MFNFPPGDGDKFNKSYMNGFRKRNKSVVNKSFKIKKIKKKIESPKNSNDKKDGSTDDDCHPLAKINIEL